MNGNGTSVVNCPANCTTVQIIEPNSDLLVGVEGLTNDIQEDGILNLVAGQTFASVAFQVQKLNSDWRFEYLYVVVPGEINPGSVQVIPISGTSQGFIVAFAGAPIDNNYQLQWRVVVRQTSLIQLIDAPESLYLQMPRTNTMLVTFVNQRSGVNYGFSELRVENLIDPPAGQAIIRVQVAQKTVTNFLLAVNPTPPSPNYFLSVRTP